MKKETLAFSYANSLFSVAEAEGALERVEKDLDRFKELLMSQKDLLSFLKGSEATREGKKKAIREIFEKDGLSPITLNQLNLLIDQGREKVIQDFLEAYDLLLSEHRKAVRAEITTSIPLTPEETREIAKDLSKKTGKSIHLKARVKEEILGGAIVKIGEKVYDGSIRRQLDVLRKKMVE